MQYLRTNTATRITVGPALDKTDGITPEVALTVTSCKLTFIVDDGGVPTLVLDTAPTASGGNNDMVHITGDDSGYYDLELTAANVNYLGRAKLSINDVAVHCPVFHEFMIIPAVVYDAMILGTDLFDVSMTQILGTAVSSPATAGVLDVNLKNIANTAVSTSSAQLGVNVVNAGATAWGSGAITAGSIASDAITAAKIADGAIDAATFAASAITATVIASDAITAAKIADGAIDAATFAAGAINAAAIASDAITDAKVASDVTIASVTGAVGSVTGNVGGNVTGSVGSVAAGGITAASLASDTITAAKIATDAITSAKIADGAIDANTFAAGAINAAAIASDAITDAKVASDVTIASVTGAVGSVTGNVGGNVTGSVGSVASGGISASSFAAGAIDASAIAADAIGSSELAASAVTEIQSGLATSANQTTINNNILALNNLSAAAINAEVVDALATDTYAEPGQGAPGATISLAAKINYLYKAFRNKHTQTSSTYTLYADNGTTTDQAAGVSDDGTTLTRNEIGTGA